MPITDRMLMGAIASNPAAYEGAGEYRCCRACDLIFFTAAKQPDTSHDDHDWFALPALNPDGSRVLERAFQRYIKRWPQARQDELERFALKKGWEMAMELKYGGGALEEHEASEWQQIVNGRLEQLVKVARAQLAQKDSAPSP